MPTKLKNLKIKRVALVDEGQIRTHTSDSPRVRMLRLTALI